MATPHDIVSGRYLRDVLELWWRNPIPEPSVALTKNGVEDTEKSAKLSGKKTAATAVKKRGIIAE